MKTPWSSRLLSLALYLAIGSALSFGAAICDYKKIASCSLLTGDSMVAIAELLVTAAGLLFAGVELRRTQEALTKHEMTVVFKPLEGEFRGSVEKGFRSLHFPPPEPDKPGVWLWKARFDVYLMVEGSAPASHFVAVVGPPQWRSPASYVDANGSQTSSRLEQATGAGDWIMPWRRWTDTKGREMLRVASTEDFPILPGDEFYLGRFSVQVEVQLREDAHTAATPPELRLEVYSDTTLPTRLSIGLITERVPGRFLSWEAIEPIGRR